MMRYIWTALPLVFLIGLAVTDCARARWDDLTPEQKAQFAQLTPQQLQFIKTRRNKEGLYCCDDGDGYQPDRDDITWDIKSGKYRVKIRGDWLEVPDSAKLDDENIVERAIVWLVPSFANRGGVAPSQYPFNPIICFLPGPEL
jgi:hypothetical protein